MAASAQDTIADTISAYLADQADDVLKQFHTNAKIRGTKKKDKWEKKSNAKPQIKLDMATFTIKGPFVEDPVTSGEMTSLASGVMLFDRNGPMTFTRKNNTKRVTTEARWTAVLKEYSDGWKIVYSNFSLEEGKKVP